MGIYDEISNLGAPPEVYNEPLDAQAQGSLTFSAYWIRPENFPYSSLNCI